MQATQSALCIYAMISYRITDKGIKSLLKKNDSVYGNLKNTTSTPPTRNSNENLLTRSTFLTEYRSKSHELKLTNC